MEQLGKDSNMFAEIINYKSVGYELNFYKHPIDKISSAISE